MVPYSTCAPTVTSGLLTVVEGENPGGWSIGVRSGPGLVAIRG
jgi:hypothetical protein